MPYTIHIHNLQKRVPVDIRYFEKAVRKVLQQIGSCCQADLSIVIMTDRGIRLLNFKYLDHDFPTDVLAFDLSGDAAGKKQLEGEIYVSAPTAARQARAFGMTVDEELLLYMVHGILHLSGYDDHTAPGRKKMRAEEQRILNAVLGRG